VLHGNFRLPCANLLKAEELEENPADAVAVEHEGVHIDQGNAWLNGGESSVADINHYFREQHAWALEGSVAMALGMNSLAPHGGGKDFQVWNKGWKALHEMLHADAVDQ
jgi:hypothetical protein